jgi:hypothetical protein
VLSKLSSALADACAASAAAHAAAVHAGVLRFGVRLLEESQRCASTCRAACYLLEVTCASGNEGAARDAGAMDALLRTLARLHAAEAGKVAAIDWRHAVDATLAVCGNTADAPPHEQPPAPQLAACDDARRAGAPAVCLALARRLAAQLDAAVASGAALRAGECTRGQEMCEMEQVASTLRAAGRLMRACIVTAAPHERARLLTAIAAAMREAPQAESLQRWALIYALLPCAYIELRGAESAPASSPPHAYCRYACCAPRRAARAALDAVGATPLVLAAAAAHARCVRPAACLLAYLAQCDADARAALGALGAPATLLQLRARLDVDAAAAARGRRGVGARPLRGAAAAVAAAADDADADDADAPDGDDDEVEGGGGCLSECDDDHRLFCGACAGDAAVVAGHGARTRRVLRRALCALTGAGGARAAAATLQVAAAAAAEAELLAEEAAAAATAAAATKQRKGKAKPKAKAKAKAKQPQRAQAAADEADASDADADADDDAADAATAEALDVAAMTAALRRTAIATPLPLPPPAEEAAPPPPAQAPPLAQAPPPPVPRPRTVPAPRVMPLPLARVASGGGGCAGSSCENGRCGCARSPFLRPPPPQQPCATAAAVAAAPPRPPPPSSEELCVFPWLAFREDACSASAAPLAPAAAPPPHATSGGDAPHEDDELCVVCLDAPRDTPLAGCAAVHAPVLCAACVARLLAGAAPACPLCRAPVVQPQ